MSDDQSNFNDQTESKGDDQCFLHVCTSCRPSGFPREPENNRPGFKLYQQLNKRLKERNLERRINILSADCLSLCSRPCGIALSSPGSWSYLFGDQDAERSADDILDCAKTYIDADGGRMARAQRPVSLRSTILGRIPPHPQRINIIRGDES